MNAHFGGIAGMLGLAVAGPFIWKWVKGAGTDALIKLETDEVHKLLQLGPKDPDLAQFSHDVLLAAIKLAEKEMPAHGRGADKKAFVVKMVCQDVPLFRGQEQNVGELIDVLCDKNDDMLNELISEEARKADTASAPAAPASAPPA